MGRSLNGAVSVLALTSAIAWCTPAHAFTVDLARGTALVVAAPGEVNSFEVQDLAGGVVFTDLAQNPVTSPIPSGCTSDQAWEVACGPGVVSATTVAAGDRDDELANGSVLTRVTLMGGPGNDEISGGAAADAILGEAGNDSVQGGAGSDSIDGGTGNDTLTGGDGDDVLAGGDGDDDISGSDGNDTVRGDGGQDVLGGGNDNDRVNGGDGEDELTGDDGSDVLDGELGNDLLDGGRGNDVLDGADGGDEISAGEGNDRLAGGDGSDRLSAGPGNDTLQGQRGIDQLLGADGNDDLDGGEEHDTLEAGAGDDSLQGGAGDDTLVGAEGADALAGGDGNDLVSYVATASEVRLSVGNGPDDGTPGERDDVRGDVEHLLGGSGPDTLTGSLAAERLDGGPGDDVLDGGLGADVVVGGPGSDTASYTGRLAGIVATIGQAGAGEPGENDTLDFTLENLTGGSGPDTLKGLDTTANVLVGGPGDDTLDLLDNTSASDRASCGDGTDTAITDSSDLALPDCETLTIDGRQVRPALPAAPARVFLGARTLFVHPGRTVRIPARCAVGPVCVGQLRLSVKPGLTGPQLGRVGFRIAAGTSTVLELRLTPRAAQRVRLARRQGVRVIQHLTIRPRFGRPSVRDVPTRLRQGAVR